MLPSNRIGNVYGRARNSKRTILLGSHTDSVPTGGWLDGALGVIYGLEIALALHEHPAEQPIGVDVIDFQDEEGTVQGPRLEAAGCTIGIVRGIVGIRRFRAQAFGQADHAGTTPMDMRHDAARALFDLMDHVYREFPRIGGRDTVWNIGSISIRPGAANVVPQHAEMTIECRDLDEGVLEDLEQSLHACVKRHTGSTRIEIERTYCISPVTMSQDIVKQFDSGARRLQQKSRRLPSGAGHDAMILAKVMPAGMMFIPSIGGRSHSSAEDSKEEHIVAGCRIFASAVDGLMSDRATLVCTSAAGE